MDCLETAERSSSTPPGSRVRKRELARPAKPQPASPSYTAKGTHFPRRQQIPKGLVKPSGSFTRAPRRYAVVLGCEADQASDFVYADAIDRAAPPTPIGISCRLCPRADCDQRAFPPADRAIRVDPTVRAVVPYQVT